MGIVKWLLYKETLTRTTRTALTLTLLVSLFITDSAPLMAANPSNVNSDDVQLIIFYRTSEIPWAVSLSSL